jgi:hypothetical protein
MKKLIHSKGIGTNNESWWYLILDITSGSLFVEHEWNNMNYSLKIDQGLERFNLQELLIANSFVFNNAIATLKKIFHEDQP